MKHLFNTSFSVLLLLVFNACKDDKIKIPDQPSFVYDRVTPANFPKVDIPGFHFPEDSTTLNKWISADETDKIYTHAWGIWEGLTTPTNQKVGGQTLLVYETWLTPAEMIDSINGRPINRSNRANLKKPRQFSHGFQSVSNAILSPKGLITSIHESVAYSPAAASHAIQNKLFLASTLYAYTQQGMTDIPDFPDDAITIKPVFKVLPASVNKTQDKFAIATWHGPIDSLKGFGETAWNSGVYVDIKNQSPGGDGSQLMFPTGKVPPATPATTYNLNDFIHYTMNKEDAFYFNKEFTENAGDSLKANAGDIVILVGMHVTTKENKRWTWQSYWWAPDAKNPPAPSSKAIADKKPASLKGAAAHYAMALAYYMVNPKEPYSGTNITGNPNYGYNPYLEAGFGPNVFDKTISLVKSSTGIITPTYVGVRTNCMSCHTMATINPDSLTATNIAITPYVGNSYVSLGDPIFKGQLKLDFAWSIEGNVDTTGFKAYLKAHPKK